MGMKYYKTYPWLLPLSWLYCLVTTIRNLLFDAGILKERSFPLPVINVGNLTAGGTGKTPHTEYLIRLLSERYNVAVLSRGYRRETSGFVMADDNSTSRTIGDEPYQMHRKFPKIRVAVDARRCHGVEELMRPTVQPAVDIILLDDAYQHRYIKADINILLIDYNRPVTEDLLLPAGRLRESSRGVERADIIIITKCPDGLTPIEQHGIERSLSLQAYQKIFFTRMRYPDKMPEFSQTPLLLTGIATPQQMLADMRGYYPGLEMIAYPDHHQFSETDIDNIRKQADGRPIITTEKDSTRLPGSLPHTVVPVEVEFIGNGKKDFNKIILDYVHKNSRNSRLHKVTNAE